MKKIIALICAMLMIAACFAGCGTKEETTATTDGKNFTFWTVMDSMSGATLGNYGEMMMYQEMEKRTGVHIDFIHPIEGSTGNEAFIAMLSGEKLPDMIEYVWSGYTGGPQQALDDEVIICLNDYLEEHAPNYYEYMEGETGKANQYRWKLEATTDDGRYYGFNILNIGTTKAFAGLYARGDKLKEWGMETPETIDEWTALFAKAKAEGFQKPFTSVLGPISFTSLDSSSFNSAFGVGKGLYLEGDKVVFGPFQKGFKEYVAQLAEWTKAGYIDTGFVTNDGAKVEGNMANDISVAAFGYIGSGIGKIMPAAQAKNPAFELVACPYPVDEEGGKAEFQQVYPEATARAIAITPACGNIEKAVEWCDYIYSEEGSVLQIFGIEGETYTVEEREDGTHYVYTDKIKYPTEFNSVNEALYHHMLPCNHPGFNQHPDYLEGYYPYQQQIDAVKIWNECAEYAKAHRLPTLSYTEEESREQTDIKEIAEAELEVAICDIILGKKGIDTYDAAIKKAKENGYDRYIEISQGAYDRYISKLDN